MKKFFSIKYKLVSVLLISATIVIISSILVTSYLSNIIFYKNIKNQLVSRDKNIISLFENYYSEPNAIQTKIKDFIKPSVNKILYVYFYDKKENKSDFYYLDKIFLSQHIKEKHINHLSITTKKYFFVDKIFLYNIKNTLKDDLGEVYIGYDLTYLAKSINKLNTDRIIYLSLFLFILVFWILYVSEKLVSSLKKISNFLLTTTTTERLTISTNDETSIIAQNINSFIDTIQKNMVSITKLEQEIKNHKETREILSTTINTQQAIIKMLVSSYNETDLKTLTTKILDCLTFLPLIKKSSNYKISFFVISSENPKVLESIAIKTSPNCPFKSCTKINFGECFCGKAIENKEFIVSKHNFNEDEIICKEGVKFPHHHICAPIIYKEKPLGVIEFSFNLDDTNNKNFDSEKSYNYEIQNIKFTTTIIAEILNKFYEHIEHKLLEEKMLHQTKLASIGQLAAGVAHELNNPLTTILGNSQLLLEDFPENNLLKDIEYSAKRMHKIILDLLEFSRNKDYNFNQENIIEILDTAINLTKKFLEKNKVVIEKNYNFKELKTFVSKNHLEQVFINVITNATKAMPKGGLLSISIQKTDLELKIFFKDTGTGIKKELLDHLFEPFFTTDKFSGTGLGLYICYEIMRKHNGEIKIFSEGEHKGTTVEIVLPYKNLLNN